MYSTYFFKSNCWDLKHCWYGNPQGIINYHINNVLNKNRHQHKNNPLSKVSKKDIVILLTYLHVGLQSNQVTKFPKSCVYKFYSCVNLNIIFHSTQWIKSFFPYKDCIYRSQQSKIIYRTNCWDCNGFTLVKLYDGFMVGKPNTLRPLLKMTIA